MLRWNFNGKMRIEVLIVCTTLSTDLRDTSSKKFQNKIIMISKNLFV